MIKVRIPATSANIGSGFDTLGLAVSLYNYVTMEEFDGVDIRSEDATPVPTTEKNLIYATAAHFYEICGKKLSGLRIRQLNNIPMTRGLGSSSACIVGGLVGANALLGCPMGTDELVNLAADPQAHDRLILRLNSQLNQLIRDEIGEDSGQEVKDCLSRLA